MKRLILAGGVLLLLLLSMVPLTTATPTTDDRVTVTAVSGTLDFDYYINDSGSLYYNNTIYLPCEFVELYSAANVLLNITATNATYGLNYSIVSNGAAIITNAEISGMGSHLRTYDTFVDNVPDNTTATIWINISCNVTNNTIVLHFWGSDVPIADPWLVAATTYTNETDNDTPDVGGLWGVTDNITVLINQYNVTDVDVLFDYPSSSHLTAPTVWVNDTDITMGVLSYTEITYQKMGPAHELDENDVDETITGTSHEVTVEFDSVDELTEADWTINPSDTVWDGAFATLDESTLAIEINNHDLDDNDWSIGSIDMENVDIRDSDNTVVFTWTAAAGGTGGTGGTGVTTPAPSVLTTEYWIQEYNGVIPYWAIAAIIIIVVLALILVYYVETKKKK